MAEDRCECGQRVRCPKNGETVLANRSGTPFQVSREMANGVCYLTVHHLEDGATGMPFSCQEPGAEEERGLSQLHMLGERPERKS